MASTRDGFKCVGFRFREGGNGWFAVVLIRPPRPSRQNFNNRDSRDFLGPLFVLTYREWEVCVWVRPLSSVRCRFETPPLPSRGT